MPDDERSRRRLGDETKGRIADLASGWDAPAGKPEPAPTPGSSIPSSIAPSTPSSIPPGDETKLRIAELASGWDAPAASPAPAAPSVTAPVIGAAPEPRRKPKTVPPPPPGSEARKALEAKIVDTAPSKQSGSVPAIPAATKQSGSVPAIPAARPKPPTTPPPPPPPRSAKPTAPPPIPPPRAKAPTGQLPLVEQASGKVGTKSGAVAAMPLPANAPAVAPYATTPPASTPARASVVVDEPVATSTDNLAVGDDSKLLVPIGEFEDNATVQEPDKLRLAHSQRTIKRDAANAVLQIAEAPLTQVKPIPVEVLLTESAEHLRGDPTAIDSATTKFERGDPTALGRTDNTAASTPPAGLHTAAGRLRTVAALRRQRGLLGDALYVRTALFGVRRARTEFAELEAKQATRQQGRRRYLVTLGRTAVVSEDFDHPALGPAREQLGSIEDERSRHTGQVVAADQELTRVTRDREAKAKQFTIDIASLDAELAELQKRHEPLLKEQAAGTRRAAELREALRRADARIAEATASMVSVKGPKQDPAAIQAELATLKADRVAVQRDEPKLAAELDALNPRIAAIEAKRSDSTKRRAELVQSEEDDKRRTEELLAAIGAKRKVMDRAAGDAEALRDKILFELGERLYVDHPDDLGPQLAPIDSIDVDLGVADRRLMELREILSSIDKAKLARGILVILVTLGAIGSLAGWLIYMLA